MTNEDRITELGKEVAELGKELALVKGLIDSHLLVADVIDTEVGKKVEELKLTVAELVSKQNSLEIKIVLLETGRKTRKEVFTTIAAWIGIIAVILGAIVGAIKFLSP